MKQKSGQIVVPGDKLGVIEEFVPGLGTYVENDTIYSLTIGRALMDLLNKQVSIYPRTRASGVPRVGSTIVGQVSEAQSKQAVVHIFRVGNRMLSGFFTGLLHISDVSLHYVETLNDVCKIGDIVRAKVVSDKNRTFHLSTNDKDLGVVYAFCSRCGYLLSLRKPPSLQCPACSNVEHRKTAQDYGKGEI
jgi:exosome complex component CSL4